MLKISEDVKKKNPPVSLDLTVPQQTVTACCFQRTIKQQKRQRDL